MGLKEIWARLDSEIKEWLVHNSGCVSVPSCIAGKMDADAEGHVEWDAHGGIVLTPGDRAFLRDRAEAAGTIHCSRSMSELGRRFFNSEGS